MKNKVFTDKEIECILEQIKLGKTDKEIALIFNCNAEKIRHQRRRRKITKNIPKQDLSDEYVKKQIETLRDDGKKIKEIAKILNKTETQISGFIHKYNIPRKITFVTDKNDNRLKENNSQVRFRRIGREWDEELTNLLIKLKSEGVPHKEIARQLNTTLPAVREKLSRLKITKPKYDAWTNEETLILREMHSKNLSLYEMAFKLDKNIINIYRRLHYLKLKVNFAEIQNIKEVDIKDILRVKYHHSQRTAKTRNIPHEISLDDFISQYEKQNEICYYSGIKMNITGNRYTYGISLDRKDSSIGYTKENIVFCLYIVNIMKQRMSEKEFVHMCSCIVKHNE